jgi:hypothetical protein
MELKGRSMGLSVSRPRGVLGVLGRGRSWVFFSGVEGTDDAGRGLDMVRDRDSVEMGARYFFAVLSRLDVDVVEWLDDIDATEAGRWGVNGVVLGRRVVDIISMY